MIKRMNEDLDFDVLCSCCKHIWHDPFTVKLPAILSQRTHPVGHAETLPPQPMQQIQEAKSINTD